MQKATSEIEIGNLPADSELNRVRIVLVQFEDGSSEFELRQESWSDAVGWFEQSRVGLGPDQVAGLKSVLSVSTNRTGNSSHRRTAPARMESDSSVGKDILQFRRVS